MEFIDVNVQLPLSESRSHKFRKGSPYFSKVIIAKTSNGREFKAYYGIQLKKFFKYYSATELKGVTHWKPKDKQCR